MNLKDFKCVGMYRVLAEITDSADGAIFLSQLIYWDKHVNNEWFYKTRDEWHFETAIKKDRQVTLCKQLVALGILETKIQGLPARTHYRLSREGLQQRFDAIVGAERYLRHEKTTTVAYYQPPDLGCADSAHLVAEISATGDGVRIDNQLPETPPSDEINTQPVGAVSSHWERRSTGSALSGTGYSDNRVAEIHNGPKEYPQLVTPSLSNRVPENPLPYKEKSTHESRHENTHESTHENRHQNTFVELGKNLATDFGEGISVDKSTGVLGGQTSTTVSMVVDEQFSATEQAKQQPPLSGNSSQATRGWGEKPEGLNQPNQRDAATHHRATEGDGQPADSAGSSRCRARTGDDNTQNENLSSQGEESAMPRDTSVAEEHLSKLRKMLGMPPSKNASTPAEPPGAKPKPATSSPVSCSPTGAQSMSSLLAQVTQTLEPPEDWVAEDKCATVAVEPETPKPPKDVERVTEEKNTPLPDGDSCVNGSALAKMPDKPLDSVADIFSHWQTMLEHPHAKLDEKRKRLIKNALKMGYSDQDLKQAITGCSQTPHNLGDNDRGQRYDGLHIILRDADQIDRFMANSINPPRKLNAQEQLERDNKRIADECLRAQGLTPVGEENIINHGEL